MPSTRAGSIRRRCQRDNRTLSTEARNGLHVERRAIEVELTTHAVCPLMGSATKVVAAVATGLKVLAEVPSDRKSVV